MMELHRFDALPGKTVKRVIDSDTNQLILVFTDDTYIVLCAEGGEIRIDIFDIMDDIYNPDDLIEAGLVTKQEIYEAETKSLQSRLERIQSSRARLEAKLAEIEKLINTRKPS